MVPGYPTVIDSTFTQLIFYSKRLLMTFQNALKRNITKYLLTFQDLNEMNLKPQQINYFLVLVYKYKIRNTRVHTQLVLSTLNIIYFIFAILYIFESSLLLLDGHLHDHEIFFLTTTIPRTLIFRYPFLWTKIMIVQLT